MPSINTTKFGGNRRYPGNIGEVFVFVPGLRIPKPVDFIEPLGDHLSKSILEHLSALRTRIIVMAAQEVPIMTRARKKSATQHGGSPLSDLLLALEDYLPVLLGLAKQGSHIQDKVQFVWVNQEDEMEANLMLLQKLSADGLQPKESEESRRASVDIFLKAAGYLNYAVEHVLPQLPVEQRRNLPVDLAEGVLKALCLQALGQCNDIQFGMAIDSTKATLAVKRRLACEMVKYWQQAQDNIMHLSLANGWGGKHRLFIKWKHIEAKAAAYYYHGLIIDEGNTEKSHGMALAALQAADEYLKESKKISEAFSMIPPLSKNPTLCGSMTYISEKIQKDASSKVQINRDLHSPKKIMETVPSLPDFELALKPDDYQLPPVDSSWCQRT